MALNKKGFGNFGTIVATIGSILIAVGIAWLLADNWHYLHSVLKIIILLGLTFSALFAGVQLKIKKYDKIGSTLIFLGSGIFTLSIFLIAQIYSLPQTLQMNSTLILISMIGVFLTAYMFNSSSSLLLGLVEMFFFTILQFVSFIEGTEFSGAYIALIFLLLGIFIYGLTLIHQKINNPFSKLYKIFSVTYFLLFAYILTFEFLLPNLWTKGFAMNTKGIIYLVFLGIIALATFGFGLKSQLSNIKKEIMFFGIIIATLTIIIFGAYFILSDVGSCSAKSCYDSQDQLSCNSLQLGTGCVWKDNYCQDKSCYIYNDKNLCEAESINGIKCVWDKNNCVQDDCYIYNSENECIVASKRFNNTCKWETNSGTGYCGKIYDPAFEKQFMDSRYEFCQNIKAKNSCSQESTCKWGPYNQYNGFNGRNEPLKVMMLWIFNNIIFLALIILFIFFASVEKNKTMINIGIIFFGLDIFTRYVGFIVDYSGYLSLSIFFITGGVILVFGGYFIEKWRRKLIEKTEKTTKKGGKK